MKKIIDQFGDIKKFKSEMNKMFEDFWKINSTFKKNIKIHEPNIDIENKKDKLEIKVDLPGIDKKNIQVNLGEDRLELSAKKQSVSKVKNKNYYRQERSSSGFYRLISLPAFIDVDNTKSEFKNGVLKITMPKLKKIKNKNKKLLIK